MAKKEDILDQHPEFLEKARSLFNYDKTPVVQESVPRGDATQPTLNPNEVTNEDLEALAKYAAGIVDPRIQAADRGAAIDDAVLRAIDEKDDGRYSHRISATTSMLIRNKVDDLLKKNAGDPGNLNDKMHEAAKAGQAAEIPENKPVESTTYEEPRIQDPQSENNGPKPYSKEAGKKDTLAPLVGTKPTQTAKKNLKTEVSQMSTTEKKNLGAVLQAVAPKAPAAKKPAGKKSGKSAALVAALDKLAGELQAKGLVRLASELDTVSNTLEQQG
jgi:hypothetical protein